MDLEAMDEKRVLRKRKSKLKISKNVKNYCREYCNSTSIHGIRYFGERRRTIYEKIWWTVAIIVSFVFCLILIVDTYKKWERSPVIMTFATTEKPIWQIPFPAVTICPDIKSDPHLFNYTQYLYKKEDNATLTEEEENYFGFLSIICHYRHYLNYSGDYVDGDDIYDFFDNVTSHIKHQFMDIQFMGKTESFDEVFMPIFTDEGVCYTFNMLDREDMFTDEVKHYKDYHDSNFSKSGWSLENGYNIGATKNAYPKRALFSGAFSALDIKLAMVVSDADHACTGGIQGYKVLVHHPAKMPLVRRHYIRVPHDQSVIASITPRMIQTSDDVKSYSPRKRECYFPSERKLRYFKFYTQTNCQMECLTNFTLDECGCVNFFMPHDNVTLVCAAANIKCTMDAESNLLTNYITTQLDMLENKHRKTPIRENYTSYCDCLPVCISISYSAEISQNDWDWKKAFEAERIVPPNETQIMQEFRLAQLKIFFKTNQFIPSERRELYSPTDLLANFGGLLGLFTGFSLLSLVEIVYFLSLRIYCNIKLYGRRVWSGDHEI